MNFKIGIVLLAPVLALACSGSSESPGGPAPGAGGADASVGGAAGTSTGGSAGTSSGGTAGTSTGGSAGTSSGGAAGTSAGGSAGTSGQAGTAGSAGGVQAVPECTDASQCKLLNDCCNCMPLAGSESGPTCNIPNCYVATCTPKGVSEVECAAGQCVLTINCDASKVLCNGMPPNCPKGEVPTVANQCWTGQCIKATYCPMVASCADCDSTVSTCVVWDTQMGPQSHCVEVPDVCKGKVDCSCLGNAVCTPPFGSCNDSNPPGTSIHCGCPTC